MRYATFSTFSVRFFEHCIQSLSRALKIFLLFTCFESALIALEIVVLSCEFLVIPLGPRMLVRLAETITFSPQGGVLFGGLTTSCLGGGGADRVGTLGFPFHCLIVQLDTSSRLGALLLVSSPELLKLLTDVVVFLVDAVAFLLKVMDLLALLASWMRLALLK